MHRFLIDECLSVRLPSALHARGYEAYHVVHRGLGGRRDDVLRAFLLENDAVLVTNNADDFLKLHGDLELHPGLMIIVPNVPYEKQLALLEAGLQALKEAQDLVNRVIEIHAVEDVRTYEWPAP